MQCSNLSICEMMIAVFILSDAYWNDPAVKSDFASRFEMDFEIRIAVLENQGKVLNFRGWYL